MSSAMRGRGTPVRARAAGALLAVMLAACGQASPTPSSSPTMPELDLDSVGWWVTDPLLNDESEIVGYRLRVGSASSADEVGEDVVDLAPWMAQREVAGVTRPTAVGPARGTVAYLADDGTESEIRVAHVAGGVGDVVASFAEAVGAMAIDPAGTAAYVVLLDRATIADRGVWRVALGGGEEPQQVMAPSDRSTPVSLGAIRLVAVLRFVRQLAISPDGSVLARRACGDPFACDLDVVSLIDGDLQHVEDTRVSELLAVVDGFVVGGSEDVCDPAGECRRTALQLSTGQMVPIGPSDGRDRIAVGDDGRGLNVALEDVAGMPDRRRLLVTDLRSGRQWAATQPLVDLWYEPPFAGQLGIDLPAGWIAVTLGEPVAIHLSSGVIVPLELPEPSSVSAGDG
jgi:hypothetical protein